MATTTSKLALTKPDGTDLVDIAVLNANADKIDAASGATICTSTTRPASPWNGQVIFETDTLNALVYRTSTSSWAILGGSTVASDPPAGAGNGNFWWDSDNGKLYIYYNDGNSGQWVSVMPSQTQVVVSPNYLINAAFDINQRNFSSVTSGPSSTSVYGFDRWQSITNTGSVVYSAQSFGTSPTLAPGVEVSNYARLAVSGQSSSDSYAILAQVIENVKTLSGKTVTVSFWAKAASGTPGIAVCLEQFNGSAYTRPNGKKVTLSTSWARYSVTLTVPSVSGQTLGADNITRTRLELWCSAGSANAAATESLGTQANTFDIAAVQLEEGSIATAFRRNGENIEAELAGCQRYYWRWSSSLGDEPGVALGVFVNSTTARIYLSLPVEMRILPSSLGQSNLYLSDQVTASGVLTSFSYIAGRSTTKTVHILAGQSGYTFPTRIPAVLIGPPSAIACYLEVNAEF